MRFLSFHVDYFWYKVTKKGRSGLVEEITDSNKENRVVDAIILFISIEKQDETSLNGSKLELSGNVNFTLGVGDVIWLRYNTGDSKWYEITRTDN